MSGARGGATAETAAASGRPLAPLGSRSARVVDCVPSGSYSLLTVSDDSGPMPRAGQFYMLRAPLRWGSGDARGEPGRPYLGRALSFATAARVGEAVVLGFLLEDVGPGTGALIELGGGEAVELVGPLGSPFSHPSELAPEAAGAVLVGGGIGLAPIVALRQELSAAGVALRTFAGFRNREHAGGLDLLRCAEVGLASDDGHLGHHGRVTDLLARLLAGDAAASACVYACGPPAMLETVRLICAEAGVEAELALEAPMACGFGACFGCAVPLASGGYARLCVEGPVLRAASIETALVEGSGH